MTDDIGLHLVFHPLPAPPDQRQGKDGILILDPDESKAIGLALRQLLDEWEQDGPPEEAA